MMKEPRESSWIKFALSIAVLICTLTGGGAVLYARLCVLETKVDIIAERIGKLEQRLLDKKQIKPVTQVDRLQGNIVAR